MANEDGHAEQSTVDTADSPFVSKKKLRRDRAKLRELKQEKKQPLTADNKPTTDYPPKTTTNRSFIRRIYEDHYKQLLWIPNIILILALLQIGFQMATTGDFLNKGVSIKGGVTMTIFGTAYEVDSLKELLAKDFPTYDIEVKAISSAGQKTGLIVEAGITDEGAIATFVSRIATELNLEKEAYSTEIIGSSLGGSFFKQTILSLVMAFAFMSLVVFIYFRIPIPSAAVVIAAFSDIVVTIAIVNLLGVKVSTGGIAAFLMLIGYSVDTDIILTSRVLHRDQNTSVLDAVYSAISTGLMTTITAIIAVGIGLIFSESDVLKQIMLIILIGLLVDTIFTWIQNAALLRWYMEKKQHKQQA